MKYEWASGSKHKVKTQYKLHFITGVVKCRDRLPGPCNRYRELNTESTKNKARMLFKKCPQKLPFLLSGFKYSFLFPLLYSRKTFSRINLLFL